MTPAQKRKREKGRTEGEKEKRKERRPVPPKQHKARTWHIFLNKWEERLFQTQERSDWIFFKNIEELVHSNPTLYVYETDTVTPLRLMADLIASAVPQMCIATLQTFAQEACGVETRAPPEERSSDTSNPTGDLAVAAHPCVWLAE